jgi:hypothetical protein
VVFSLSEALQLKSSQQEAREQLKSSQQEAREGTVLFGIITRKPHPEQAWCHFSFTPLSLSLSLFLSLSLSLSLSLKLSGMHLTGAENPIFADVERQQSSMLTCVDLRHNNLDGGMDATLVTVLGDA